MKAREAAYDQMRRQAAELRERRELVVSTLRALDRRRGAAQRPVRRQPPPPLSAAERAERHRAGLLRKAEMEAGVYFEREEKFQRGLLERRTR